MTLPDADALEAAIRREPAHPLTAARAELLPAMRSTDLPAGRVRVAAPLEARLDPGRRPSGTTCRSPSIRASATTSSPTIRCSTARRSAGRPARTSACSRGSVETARRRRGAVGRLGHHGAAGLREEPELREQPAAAGRPADRQRPHDLRRRPPGRRRLGLDRRASRPRRTRPTTCGSARASPAWAARCTTCSATTSPSSTTSPPTAPGPHEPRPLPRHHAIATPDLRIAVARRLLPRPLPGDRSRPRRRPRSRPACPSTTSSNVRASRAAPARSSTIWSRWASARSSRSASAATTARASNCAAALAATARRAPGPLRHRRRSAAPSPTASRSCDRAGQPPRELNRLDTKNWTPTSADFNLG